MVEQGSKALSLLYGSDYPDKLGNIHTGVIGYESETGANNTLRTAFRVLALFGLLMNLSMHFILYPAVELTVYLTNWALILSTVVTLLVLKGSLDPNIQTKKGQLAATHILFQLATVINLVVVFVYWLTIHSKVIENHSDSTIDWLHQHLVHIIPCLAVVIVFLTTDIKIMAGHAKCFPPVAVLFGVVNCYHVKKTGEPTYWFLTWEDHNSPLVILAILLTFTGLFLALAQLSNYLKHAEKVVAAVAPELSGEPMIKIKRKRNCTQRFRKRGRR